MGYLLMIFATLLLGTCGRLMHGCLRWVVVLCLIVLISHRDPEFMSKVCELFNEGLQAARQWIMSL